MPRRRASRQRRRPSLWWLLLLLAVVVVALGVLALPFLDAPDHASSARADLQAAREAMTDGDQRAARAHVASARADTDVVQDSVQGIGGDVWSWVPLAGGPVRDVRRLGNALDELVEVAELGVEAWPQVTGEEATLYNQGNVDLPTLEHLTTEVRSASKRLDRARRELEDIADRRLLAGGRLGAVRDEALDAVAPLADGAHSLDPLLDVLPQILGGEEDRRYVLALLNPSELMYSGGTPQAYFTMSVTQGKLEISETLDGAVAPWIARDTYWPKVPGNPFHRGKLKPATATMAPDWSVSGHELANAWRRVQDRRVSGVIAIDVVALSDLVALTGPVLLPGFGLLDSDNLVETLVGSYDEYPDWDDRRALNRALGTLFAMRLFSGNPVDTAQVLGDAADQRRFAVYFDDEDEQAAFDDLGLTGRLGSPEHDYVGVFTRSRSAAKSDYWQRRAVRSDVRVRDDGSARVRLRVDIHNDSPPYAQPGVDPRTGYFTRWNFLSVMSVMPSGAEVRQRWVDGKPVGPRRGKFYDHVYQRQIIDFAPQAKHVLEVEYEVPDAAEVLDDGSLAYRLAIDPQGLVIPQAMAVRVRFPKGHEVADLPSAWRSPRPGVAAYSTPALIESESFEVTAAP